MNCLESEILENLNVAVYSCDAELNVTYINPCCERLTGVDRESAINRKCYEVFGGGHCSQMQPCPAQAAIKNRAAESSAKIEYRPAGKGPVRNIRRSAVPLIREGEIEGAIVYLNESAEKSPLSFSAAFDECSYFLMFKNAPVMAFLTDADNVIRDVNDRWLVETGYSRDEAVGVPAGNFLSDESRSFASAIVLPQVWKTGNMNGVQCRFIAKGGAAFDAQMSCVVIETLAGRYCLSVVQNAAEQMRLNRELREASARLDQLNIVKSQFVSNLGYEIRTPMTNIMGFTDMLSQTGLNAEQLKLAGHIKSSSETLLSTITSLLEFTKVDSGEAGLEAAEFSFKQLVFEAVNLLMEKAAKKSIKIYYSIDSCLKYNLYGDEAKLKLIVFNLLDNAVKFSNGGEIRVRLSVETESATNVTIKVEVEDKGIGISKENLENIFMPFYQVDKGMTREHHGIGLGLTIADRYVAIMGGEKIHVESVPGQGSRFYFSVCLARAAESKKSVEAVPAQQESKGFHIGRSVLVVEDNYLNVEVICRLLKLCDCSYAVVEDGLKAIEVVRGGAKFDAILMDINLPEISGIETARKLREMGCKTPIIAVTAYTSANDRLLCMNAGMNDYLTKPINFTLLVNSIKAQCEKRAE